MPPSRTGGPRRQHLDDDVKCLHNNIVNIITSFEGLPGGNFAVFSVIEFWHQALFTRDSRNLRLTARNDAIRCINKSIAQLCAEAHLSPAPQLSREEILDVADGVRMRQGRIARHVEALLPFIGNDTSQVGPHIVQLTKELNEVLKERFTADRS